MDMETNRIENNQATISGEIVSDFEFSHELFGEKFYVAKLASKRKSGAIDTIPIMVSERLADVKADWIGQYVRISGQFRSYNRHEENRSRLILSVFARELEVLEDGGTIKPIDENDVFLDGYICKQPTYRETPLGREIADLLIAANRFYGKSDYIPCICWGRNARFASSFEAGEHVIIWGRIQSREYCKKIFDNEVETRTAYEVSVSKLEVMEEAEE